MADIKSTFVPQLWSARLQAHLDKSLVLGGLVNRDYEGEIRNAGDTVKINRVGPITINDYEIATDINYERIGGEQQILKIDQQKYFAFTVDDIEKAQANVTLVDKAMDRASYALRDTVDQRIASHSADAGTIMPAATFTDPTEVYDAIVSIGTALDEANVVRSGRWLVIPPWVYGMILKDDRFVAAGDGAARTSLLTGQVGQAAGFTILMSNNLVADADAGTVNVTAGTNAAISMAYQVNKMESLRLEKQFGDGVRGLMVYGSKVIEPKALVTLPAKKA